MRDAVRTRKLWTSGGISCAPIAQGRHGNDESAEPEVQVFAKRSRIHRCPQVTVRRGYDSSVYFDAALGAHSADFSFL